MDFENLAYDIIILAGQSNAAGCGVGEVSKEYEEDEDILSLSRDFSVKEGIENNVWKFSLKYEDTPLTIDIARERIGNLGKVGDLSLSFSAEYKKSGLLKEGRKILIIRAGVGGTGFFKKQWTKDGVVYSKMIEMIDYALSLNKDNRIVAFLWHQGEHDAFEGNPPDIFESQLKELITDIKERYQTPSLPFISGDFVNEWKSANIESCAPIVEKIKAVTANENGVFIEASDLLSNNEKISNGDVIHFCRESLHILGKRYFDAYMKIKSESEN